MTRTAKRRLICNLVPAFWATTGLVILCWAVAWCLSGCTVDAGGGPWWRGWIAQKPSGQQAESLTIPPRTTPRPPPGETPGPNPAPVDPPTPFVPKVSFYVDPHGLGGADKAAVRNAGVFSGILIGVGWGATEPTQGRHVWSSVDNELTYWANKQCYLRVFGDGTRNAPIPTWVSAKVPVYSIPSKGVQTPAFWRSEYAGLRTEYRRALAAVYAADSRVAGILPEAGHLGYSTCNASPEIEAALVSGGWTAAGWLDYLARTVSAARAAYGEKCGPLGCTPLWMNSYPGKSNATDYATKKANFDAGMVAIARQCQASGVGMYFVGFSPDAAAMVKTPFEAMAAGWGSHRGPPLWIGDDWPLVGVQGSGQVRTFADFQVMVETGKAMAQAMGVDLVVVVKGSDTRTILGTPEILAWCEEQAK